MRAALPGFLLLVLSAGLASCGPDEPSRPPSILLLSIDTLRADHLGCYGYAPYGEPVSPNIDAVAAQGLRLDACFTARGQTAPSLCSMMTGKYPSSHGVRDNAHVFQGEHTTLADVLSAQGYDTAAFVSVVPDAPGGSPRKGFERSVEVEEEDVEGGKGEWDARVADLAVEWLSVRRPGDRPFFLWTHFYDVHRPYSPPAPYDEMFTGDYDGPLLVTAPRLRGLPDAHVCEKTLANEPLAPADRAYVVALYDGGIRSTDAHVGRILEVLDRQGLAENTLVVITADHGEELGEHANYYFHGNSIYDGTMRIPCILRWPAALPAGLAVPDLVQNVDFAPTFLELLGLAVPADMDGLSFAALVREDTFGTAGPRELAYMEWQDLIVAVRDPDTKYIFNPQGAHPKKPPYYKGENTGFPIRCEELYLLAADPREQDNVYREHPSRTRELRSRAVEFRDRPEAVSGWQTTEDAELLRQLAEQGYVGSLPGRPDVVFGAEDCGEESER